MFTLNKCPLNFSRYYWWWVMGQNVKKQKFGLFLCSTVLDPKAGRQSEHTTCTYPLKTALPTRPRKQVAGQSTHPLKTALPTRPESRSPVRAHYFVHTLLKTALPTRHKMRSLVKIVQTIVLRFLTLCFWPVILCTLLAYLFHMGESNSSSTSFCWCWHNW